MAKMKKTGIPKSRCRRKMCRVKGGPWDGFELNLCTKGTLPIRVNNWYGRYDHGGRWVDL